jgi:hypothetical protein
LYGWCDFIDVVADDTETDILGELFYDTAKRGLRGLCHHVGFVQNDKFVSLREQCTRFSKLFDLLPDDVDTAVV